MLAATGIIHGARPGRHRARDGADQRRDRARRICLVARLRGRPPQHRKAPDGPGRRCRQAAAHRSLAQRPGRDRHAPVAARRHRRAVRATRRAAPRAARPGRSPRRDDHARLHAHAGRATGHVRPPPDGLRRDVRARCRAPVRLPQAREPAAAGRRCARRHVVSDRSRTRREGVGLRRAVRQFARRRRRPRFRDRVRGRGRAGDGAPVAILRGTRAVVESALRLRAARRPVLYRQFDHAAEEESRRARTRPRQVRRA